MHPFASMRWTDTRGGHGREAQSEHTRMPGGQSRWSAGKDLSWEPLRIERVCEVKYDHMQGPRFRHAATFLRWRPDKHPRDCRYDQLEVTPALRAREGLRRGASGALTPLQSFGAASGSRVSCGGRSSAGTCCRFTRIRVHVWNLPRMASTSTSGGVRCAAASGWRAFHRSNPASASSFRCARPISISGCRGVRRLDGCTRAGSPACFR